MQSRLIFVIISFSCIVACGKSYSYEGAIVMSFLAKGTLLDSSGNCQQIIVNGNYLKDTSLSSNNYVTVQANITSIGKYSIYTDTVNGYWFSDSGTISSTGRQNFKLKGYGKVTTPLAATFIVHFDTSICSFTIPNNKALFYFNALSGNCPNLIVNGKYRVGANLNISDSINVPITVKLPGTYSIETSLVNGMIFSSKGIFMNAGNYTVTLEGTGRPMTAGVTQVPINDGNTFCSFSINTVLDTTMYWKCTAEGINYEGLLDSAYGSLPDTGYFKIGNPNRIYGFVTGGGDKNNDQSIYNIGISLNRINSPIIESNYYPCMNLGTCDFGTYISLVYGSSGQLFNIYVTSNNLNDFTAKLISYDPVSKLVRGTFSGSMYKTINLNIQSSTPIVKITNGEFKTYLAH